MWRFVECCGFAIYSGLTPPLLHSSTRLVNSGAELTGGSSLCPLQIPGPITVSKRRTNQSTYTLRTTLGCAPFFLVLGPVLLQISQRTIEKTIRQKGYQAIRGLRSAFCGLRSAVCAPFVARDSGSPSGDRGPRLYFIQFYPQNSKLTAQPCLLRSANCGPRSAICGLRTAFFAVCWRLTKLSSAPRPCRILHGLFSVPN
jgi:hypothetical protein